MNLTEFMPCAGSEYPLPADLAGQLKGIVRATAILLLKNQQSLVEIYELSNRQLGTAKPK
jgi:hypothetical protein